ncbi:hypothetical protein H7I87_00460 [Mycobacterium timonense]|uniref:Uncharacterized protein n=2 Tax=Mycobacterium avium complex (MAC) TaxID=120793 RepID=A0AAW5RZQ8_MYCBC|nr:MULTISPECIES: hypothetical protein [Mycobacterium avium complex (MAC)]MCV6988690.1 hypothetical protein [Mycobacterium bouchedurhonense]MCV6993238.1 hypothetical protein [Mycobacterium timonense]MDV3306599.1 hypothetical protein [Mycobacterium avium subsp. hominissuis]ORA45518.1 hypothetical protein BST19_20070 [Mycobacterium bouchedurhonense]
MSTHTNTVVLQCEPASSATLVTAVRNGGSSVVLGTPATCMTDADRVAIAREYGFPTRAEREYAKQLSLDFFPQSSGAAFSPCWTVTFDMSDYFAALDEL